jgi:phosphocarrier protein
MGGTTIRIHAGGSDEEQAVEELVKLVESGFAE